MSAIVSGLGTVRRWWQVRPLRRITEPEALRAAVAGLAQSPAFQFPASGYARLAEEIRAVLGAEAPSDLAERLAREASVVRAEHWLHGAVPGDVFARLPERVEGRPLLEAAVAEGAGVVVVSAHMGYLYLLANALRGLGHDTVFIIREQDERMQRGSWLRKRLFPHWEAEVSDEGRTIRTGGAFRRAVAHLQAGGALLVMGDGRVRAETDVRLLERAWTLAEGPYTLARAAEAPMVAAVLRRRADGAPWLRFERFAMGETPEDDVASYAAMLERWVREIPEMWVRHWGGFLHETGAREAGDPT